MNHNSFNLKGVFFSELLGEGLVFHRLNLADAVNGVLLVQSAQLGIAIHHHTNTETSASSNEHENAKGES